MKVPQCKPTNTDKQSKISGRLNTNMYIIRPKVLAVCHFENMGNIMSTILSKLTKCFQNDKDEFWMFHYDPEIKQHNSQ